MSTSTLVFTVVAALVAIALQRLNAYGLDYFRRQAHAILAGVSLLMPAPGALATVEEVLAQTLNGAAAAAAVIPTIYSAAVTIAAVLYEYETPAKFWLLFALFIITLITVAVGLLLLWRFNLYDLSIRKVPRRRPRPGSAFHAFTYADLLGYFVYGTNAAVIVVTVALYLLSHYLQAAGT